MIWNVRAFRAFIIPVRKLEGEDLNRSNAPVRRAPLGRAVLALCLLSGGALLVTAAAPAEAQSRRERAAAAERAKPKPNLAYEAREASCAPAYHAAMKGLFARPTPQPMSTAKAVRATMPELTGRWLFHAEGDRRRQRDDLGRLVEGKQVCVEEQSRGGRTRCARWEQRADSAEPPVPVPPPTKDEARVIGAISEMVANKGAPPEFLGNGRYTVMTERVAGDLEAYALQDEHPALCSGVDEFIDFFEEKLAPLRKRMGDVVDWQERARSAIVPRIAQLRAQLAPPVVATPTAATGIIDTQPAAAVLTTNDPAPAETPAATPLPSPRAALADVAALIFMSADARVIAAEPTPLGGLKRAQTLFASGRSTATPAARAHAKAALRAIEAAVYFELLGQRYRDLETALFGNLDDVRKAHATHCKCNG